MNRRDTETQRLEEIEWQGYQGHSFNPQFSGYKAGHYCTGNPELGWCLYSGCAGCWNQRTKTLLPPEPGAEPRRRPDGTWYWVSTTASAKEAA